MADNSGCKVRDLLPDELDGMETEVRQALEKDAGAGGAKLAWSFIGSQATDAIADTLDFDVFELLARGWCAARELHEYTNPARHPRGEHSVVQLGEHKFTTSVHPVLKCSLDAVALPTLRFTLEFTATVEAVALDIVNGHITAAGAGECYVSAQLKYGEVKLHKPLASRHVKLPGRLTFKRPGFPIG